jgi:non-canonical purine NTP pyrophosphatase (RdgB/HAM1 family)
MSDIFPKLTLVTGSAAKLEEVRRITGRQIDQLAVDLPEVQAVDVHEVVSAKALAAFRAAGSAHPVLVEDTGLFIEAWNGLPGALIRWFEERVGPVGICKMLDGFSDRQATAQTVLGLFDGRLRTYSGQVTGVLASQPRGDAGFGFDSIFIPEGSTLTFAEMGPKAKDRYSMRRIALDQLMTDLGNDATATEVRGPNGA